MKPLRLGKLTIGTGHPVAVIAEIADSHNGSIDTAKRLVDAAKAAGADIAKFQLHLPDTEMVPGSIQMWDGPLYSILKRNLFTPEMHAEMMRYCESVGIEYLCTPFCPAAVDVLNDLGVQGFKVGSGELTNLPMQRKLAVIARQTGKPVIVSTGMSKFEEIEETVEVWRSENALEHLMLMNCTSEYPPNDYSHANLGMIPRMEKAFNVWVGQSDHMMDNFTAWAAVALGARAVEKHFTLSRNQKGPDHAISLEPQMMKDLVDGIRKIEISIGSEKRVSAEEQVVRDWAYHSVVVSRDIKAGEVFNHDNLMPKRPGSGIPAKFLDPRHSVKLLGRRALRDLPKDTILQWADIAEQFNEVPK